jgi:hypothetical protein
VLGDRIGGERAADHHRVEHGNEALSRFTVVTSEYRVETCTA